MAIDIVEIRRNAASEGIRISEIAVLYRGLSDEQFERLNFLGLLVSSINDGDVLARLPEQGDVPFPDLAVGAMYLAA